MIVVPPFAQSARNNTQASEIAKRARNAFLAREQVFREEKQQDALNRH
jgi:hypothetical protein